MLKFGLLGKGFTVVPPILAGEYIWYSYDPTDGFAVSETGNVIVDQDTVTPNYDGAVHASNIVALSPTSPAPMPIIHQLGAEEIVSFPNGTVPNAGFDVVVNVDVLECTVIDVSPSLQSEPVSMSAGETKVFSINVLDLTRPDSLGFRIWADGVELLNVEDSLFKSTGIHTLTFTAVEDYVDFRFYCAYNNGALPQIGDIVNLEALSIQPITTDNSYATFTHADGSLETIPSEDLLNGRGNCDVWDDVYMSRTNDVDVVVADGVMKINSPTDLDISGAFVVPYEGAGITYEVDFDIPFLDSAQIGLWVGKSLGNNVYYADSAFVVGTLPITFTTTSDSTDEIFVSIVAISTGGSIHVDNMTINKVLPLATTYSLSVPSQNYFTTDVPVTQADRDYMQANPNAFTNMMVTNTEDVNISFSIANVHNWFPMTEGKGEYLQDWLVPLGAELIDVEADNWNLSANVTEDATHFILGGANLGNAVSNVSQSFSVGQVLYLDFLVEEYVEGGIRVREPFNDGSYAKSGNGQFDRMFKSVVDGVILHLYATVTPTTMKIRKDTLTLKEVFGAVQITNFQASQRLNNQRYGTNDLRVMKDPSGRITNVVENTLVRFDGTEQRIETGVALDGTLADFSMFMAFTLPDYASVGVAQNIARSYPNTANNLWISQIEGTPRNVINVSIGKFVQDITLDEALPVHAMGIVYDHITSEIGVAVDGAVLPIPVPIVFDGATAQVIFGNDAVGNSFTGYIGEGILTAGKLTEVEWQEFWNRNKDLVPTPHFNGGLFVNGGFENGLTGWLEATSWTAGDNSADNPGTILNELLYQNFTLEAGATYEISAQQLEGDAVVSFVVNDVDSGVDITTGAHSFVGDGAARSIGVGVTTAGTTPLRVTNIKLEKV